MDFNELFRLGEKNILEDTEEINLKGKEDEEVRKIILDNFPKLFPHLELFNRGNPFALPHGFRGKKIPDSLAFCKNEERLWIFEYKSRIDEEMIEQVKKYRNVLKNNENLNYLRDEWYKKEKKYLATEQLKKEAKVICISPQFDNYAWGIEEEGEEEIYLIKITKYKDKKGDYFVLLQSRRPEIFNSSISNINTKEHSMQKGDKLERWINEKIKPRINNYLFIKIPKGGVGWDFNIINEKNPILSIWFKNSFGTAYNEPRIFLVNPSVNLVKKYQLKKKLEKKVNFIKELIFIV